MYFTILEAAPARRHGQQQSTFWHDEKKNEKKKKKSFARLLHCQSEWRRPHGLIGALPRGKAARTTDQRSCHETRERKKTKKKKREKKIIFFFSRVGTRRLGGTAPRTHATRAPTRR
jgi:hypothetical protein